jgi:S-adenosylmethionine-diacylgycerolhomoserine-N-methlytransferase
MAALTGGQSDRLMDRIYRHQRHIYNPTRKFYLLGRDHVIRELDPGSGNSVLEIGCGTGRNLIKTAKRYPDARCFGIDISREMLATAEMSIRRSGLRDRISLMHGDAANFDGAAMVGLPTFDRIMISYSLSMIPSWRAALERSIRALAPGGRLLIVDFGDLAGWPDWFRTALWRWLDLFHVAPRLDLPEEALRLAGTRGYPMTETSLHRGYARYIMIERPALSNPP